VISPISEFVRPRPALADCLTGMLVRDTRGCALDQTQRFNFYPTRQSPLWLVFSPATPIGLIGRTRWSGLGRSKGAQFYLRRGTPRTENHLEPRRGLLS
jgi:hypothetical protein